MAKLTPDDLKDSQRFELLAELEHRQIKKFIYEQIMVWNRLIRMYAVYQLAMLALLLFMIVLATIRFFHGKPEPLIQIAYAVLFSFTILIFLHELIHAAAYWLCGIRHLKAGAVLKKFVFYVMADREVVDFRVFRMVAFAPLVTVKIACLVLGVLFWSSPLAWFFFGIMCIHSLFCAGDMALLAFYRIHSGKEIYSYDDLQLGKSYFYAVKQ